MNTSLSSVEKHRPVAVRCDKPVNSCLHVVFKQESGVNGSSDAAVPVRLCLFIASPTACVTIFLNYKSLCMWFKIHSPFIR